jgi:two-component system sensor histidine kinase QseC
VTGAAVYFSARYWLTAEFDNALSATARSLAMVTHWKKGKVRIEFEDEMMPEFEGRSGAAYFELRLASGQIVERSPSLRGADLPARSGDAAKPTFWNLSLPNGNDGRAVCIRFSPEEDDEESRAAVPSATLVIARDRTALDRSLALLRALLISAGLVSLGGAYVIVNRAVARGLLPLEEVAARSAQIDASTLSARFPVEGMPAELRPICERLNDLLSRLEKAFERERRFTGDVAHELRTPVAELRSLAEVALRWPDANPEVGGYFRDALDIAKQMEAIVVSLLAIARCEEGRQPIRRESLDLGTLVEETWRRFAPLAKRKNLAVTIEIPPDTTVHTDRDLLRISLENLFSNAAEYSPDGGSLRIAASRNAGGVRLITANTAKELRPEDLPHLFERFWRKDSARTESNHAGLGLSITREATRALGLELSAAMPSQEVLEFSMSFPD